MRDITLEFKLLPRLGYALQQTWLCGAALVAGVVCGLELYRDVWRIKLRLPVNIPHAIGATVLFTFLLVSAPTIFRSVLRYPMAFCVRLEVQGNSLVLFARSGRRLREIRNVVADVRYRWNPKAVIFRAAPESSDCFDIPLWMVSRSARDELLLCVGWKADTD